MAESNGNGKLAPGWLVTLVVGTIIAGVIGTWFNQSTARASELEQTKTNVAVLQVQIQAMQTDLAALKQLAGDTARNVQTLVDHDSQRTKGSR